MGGYEEEPYGLNEMEDDLKNRIQFADPDQVVDLFNSKAMQSVEVPSANLHASARALARVAASLANSQTKQGRVPSKLGICQPRDAHGPLPVLLGHGEHFCTKDGAKLTPSFAYFPWFIPDAVIPQVETVYTKSGFQEFGPEGFEGWY